jgi:hypothetical protein
MMISRHSLTKHVVVVVVDAVAPEVDHPESRTRPVEVDHGPECLPGVDAEVKDPEVLPVEAVMEVAVPREVVMNDSSLNGVTLSETLGPVTGLHREVGTGVFRQVPKSGRVVSRDPDPDDAVPELGDLRQLDVDSFADLFEERAKICLIKDLQIMDLSFPRIGLKYVEKRLQRAFLTSNVGLNSRRRFM